MPYVRDWLTESVPFADVPNVIHLAESDGSREAALPLLVASVLDHLIGEDVLRQLRYDRSAQAVRNRIPTDKRIRSGTIGEIIATDYVIETGPFIVPLKRLRYTDDRDMPMRGDDIIALDLTVIPIRVLKAEVKSRVTLSPSVMTEIREALDRHEGRPKPASLAFISMALRREGKDQLARTIEELQEKDINTDQMVHLAFTVSENNPDNCMRDYANVDSSIPDRRCVGVLLPDHGAFIETIFAACNA